MCPPKLTFNPYTGCDHACVYCYASNYIPRFSECRVKKNLIRRLEKEAETLKSETISLSNSSDPYPNLEAETGLTRDCLKVLARSKCRVQIITKSPLVVRDVDLLSSFSSMVSLTITTDDDEAAKLTEPQAPPPSARLKAVETLLAKGIPTSVRIDPLIPFFNDEQERLVETLAFMGVKHITSSTYKIKTDNWKRLSRALPALAEKLAPLYFEKGEKTGGSHYLPLDIRLRLLTSIAVSAKRRGLKFGVCRENLSGLSTAACDGSWLLAERAFGLF
jgi:DNA repair photolyase